MDPDWLKSIVGEELLAERVIYVQPEHIEQSTNIYKSAVGTGTICFVLIDSIGGAPTSRRNDDATVGLFGGNAQGVGEFGRTAAALSAKYRCLTVGINQVREDMAGYNRHMTPGGRAWKHAVALRLQLKRGKGKLTEKINNEEHQIGYEIACKVVKSGLSAPGRTASWWFYNVATEKYGFGVDTMEEIVRLGILTEVVVRKGGWYHHPLLMEDKGEHKILGRDRLMEYIRERPEVQKILASEITHRLADYGSEVAPMSDPDAAMDESSFPRLSLEDELNG
jgi:recombination protein RecA